MADLQTFEATEALSTSRQKILDNFSKLNTEIVEHVLHKTVDGTAWKSDNMRITNTAEPVDDNDVATKVYVLRERDKASTLATTAINKAEGATKIANDSVAKCEQLIDTVNSATASMTGVIDAINAGRVKRTFLSSDWSVIGGSFHLVINFTSSVGAATCFGVYKEVSTGTYEGVLCTSISADNMVTLEADSAFDGFALIGFELSLDSTGVVYKPVEVTLSDTKVTEQDGVVTAVLARN